MRQLLGMTIWVFVWRILVRPIVPPDRVVKTYVAKEGSGPWFKGRPCKLIYCGDHHGWDLPVDLIVYSKGRDGYPVRSIRSTQKRGVNANVKVSIWQFRFFRKK